MLALLGEAWSALEADAPALNTLPPLGSGGAIAAVAAGLLDLGASARSLTGAEQLQGLTAWPYARSPLVMTTHRGHSPGPMRLVQIERLLGGEVAEWPDGTPVRLVRRPPTETDMQLVAGLSPGMARALALLRSRPGVPVASNDVENAAMLEERRGSLGIVMFGQLLAERRRLAPLALADLEPEDPRRARLLKPLYLVMPAAPTPAARRCLEFVREHPEARAMLSAFGHTPWHGA